MAENKKSFILYCDQKGVWDKLDNEQAGRLIKHILSYVNDDNPTAPDFITELAFEPIKQSLKRDLKKWENQYNQRVEAGHKSAEVRKRNATSVNERSISSTDNVSVNVNGSVNANANVSESVNVKEEPIIITASKLATIESRKSDFMEKLAIYLPDYGKEMLREFFDYWVEMNEGGKKMRFEMERVFQIDRRLKTWSSNNFKKNGKSNGVKFDKDKFASLLKARHHPEGTGE